MTNEERILQIAEEEFFRNGYAATSMVAVARRAGVTHAMVNYYFRSKEQLFLSILDSHTYSFIENLRPIMKQDGDFIDTLVNAAGIIFDTLNTDRMLPFLIQDVAKSAPGLLERYRQPLEAFVSSTIAQHAERLSEQVAAGAVSETGMADIIENMLILVASPYLMVPTLENICHLSPEMIDDFLSRRRDEMELMIRARYARK